MAEQETDAGGAAPVPRRRLRLRLWKPTLAQAGFTMSLTLALINAFYAIRGSVMVVQPPEQIILYRDGEGDRAVLTLAMRVAMINAADGAHGDVLMGATIQPGPDAPEFAFDGQVKPVFTADRDAGARCSLDARCVVLPGLLAMEQGEQILSIPGGQVLAATLSYPLARWNCAGGDAICARFKDFPTTLHTLAGHPLEVTVRLRFYGDGKRQLRCAARPIDLAYINQRGWMTMSCREASVRGGPLL